MIGLVVQAGQRARFAAAAATLTGVDVAWAEYEHEEEIRDRVTGLLAAERLDGLLLGLVPYAKSRDLLPAALPIAVTRSAALDLALAWAKLPRGASDVSIDTFDHETVAEVTAALGVPTTKIMVQPFSPVRPIADVVSFHREHNAAHVITCRTGVLTALAADRPVIDALATPGTIRAHLHELALRVRAAHQRFAAAVLTTTPLPPPKTNPGVPPPKTNPGVKTGPAAKTGSAVETARPTKTDPAARTSQAPETNPAAGTDPRSATETVSRTDRGHGDAASSGERDCGGDREALERLLRGRADLAEAWIGAHGPRDMIVFAPASLFEAVTRRWTGLPLLAEARETLGTRVAAGFGIGSSARQSVALAEQAAARAAAEPEPAAYLMTGDGLVIGPMTTTGAGLAATYREHGALESLAAGTGLSAAALSRLAALDRSLRGRSVSPGELARSLGITEPSGRRLIRKLAAAGLALDEGSSQPTRKGRPTRLYRLAIAATLDPAE